MFGAGGAVAESRAWPQVSCRDGTKVRGHLGHALLPLVPIGVKDFSHIFSDSVGYPVF